MKIFKSIEEFISSELKVNIFIPTMGNLHEGHLSLIDVAKKDYGNVCVSIYINENQFTDKKDFDNYPITLKQDIEKLESKHVDYLLIPSKKDINKYSKAFDFKLEPKKLTTDLCGKYKSGHFLAVMDIIHRFFQIIKPEKIILGEKDFQQIICIKELIKICDYNISVISAPVVRNKEGLALSSRNSHLSKDGIIIANSIFKSLILSKDLYDNNVPLDRIIENIYDFFDKTPLKLEYFTIRNLKSLQHGNDSDLIAIIACYLEGVRLIDNMIIKSRS